MGIVIAAVVGVVFFGAIGVLVVRARLTAPPAAPTPEPEAPDLLASEDIGRMRGSDIELYDRRDPSRLAARIRSERTDPVPDRRGMVRMEHPEAWMFLRSGRTVHVRADDGVFYMPDRQREPESGTIRGNVVVRLYESARASGADGGEPLATLRTSALTFDGTSFEVSTPERFEFDAGTLSGTGTGLKLIYNEAARRIELLEIRRGESVTHTPASGPAGTSAAAPAPPGRAVTTVARAVDGDRPVPDRPDPSPAAAEETYYQLVLSDAVTVTQGRRTVRSDRLTAWARLVDQRLPSGAIWRLDGKSADRPGNVPPRGEPVRAPAHPDPEPHGGAPRPPAQAVAPTPDETEPVTLRWTGPCVLRPLESAPRELAEDHVALRATAERSGAVTFRDDALGGEGRCATLEYGLTTGRLALTGPGPSSVVLARDDGATLEAVRAELDLVHARAVIPTPGIVYAPHEDGESRDEISWNERAEFTLARDADTGASRLREASFAGRSQATDGSALLRGERIRAEFARGLDGATLLTRLVALDPNRVLARSSDEQVMRAEELDVAFAPGADPRRPDPVKLVARGRVAAAGTGGELECAFLDADLARDDRGSVGVTTAVARSGVRFARKDDGVSASAEEARVDAARQVVDLTGPGSSVGADPTRIWGEQIRLLGVERTITVFGPWRIVHGPRPLGEDPVLRAEGTSGLTFDDLSGTAEGAGRVTAVHRPDALRRDTFVSERLRLRFTPDSGTTASDAGAQRGDRRLLHATLIGAAEEGTGDGRATSESRRYAVAEPGIPPALMQIVYVDGPRLLADVEHSVLDVPGAGRALVRDHTGPSDPDGDDLRGDSLFTWERAMRLDRAAGSMDMDGNVWVTHVRLAEDQAVRVIAEHVTAVIRSTPGPSDRVELVSASARGAVNVAVGPRDPSRPFEREITADRVDYDAATGVILASSESGNLVTLFDAARGAPAIAERITWDVRRNEIKLIRPLPVVVPR